MKKILQRVLVCTLAGVNSVYSAEPVFNKSIMDLNAQIQQQLKQIQRQQDHNLEKMNIKIQAQLAQMQKILQEEIFQQHTQVQKQIKTLQSDLQKEIREVARED